MYKSYFQRKRYLDFAVFRLYNEDRILKKGKISLFVSEPQRDISDNSMIPLALICVLSIGFLAGAILLFQQTVKGFKRVATKMSVIICTAVYVLAGIALIVISCFDLSVMFGYLLIGLMFLALAFFLVKRNFF